ncbi:MAG: Peptidoglycan D,D-transpeptidase MrdA [uncultured Gemmatimonadetes bacterium]|uniref:Peptidoglycan D,D-transpeptidase MrdA n=1 Tax=uncultured Gemmatimonadota bacterium TaxID=203437 RepID=A0A6J4KBG0_9BACT|nr:MAG: Peptidoglycan D,D-transpeptidase MrdA [uncultured Gemmatimonadota bacterium]
MAGFVERSLVPQSPFHPHAMRKRALKAGLGVGLMLSCLGAAFFRTQILRNSEFELRADDNRFRVIPIPAPRGTITDRNGKVIAETVAGYTLAVEPGPEDSVRARLLRVAPVVGLDSATIREVVERSRTIRTEPVPVLTNLSFEQVSRLEERGQRPPGIILEARPIRRYPAGAAVAHLVGWVAEISDRELEEDQWEGFRSGQHIGKGGVERAYERSLGGKLGARYVEVDARGRLVRPFAQQLSSAPTPGEDVKLTIDLDLQRYAAQIFPEGKRGAIVAMVPTTGEVLAMYSSPSYDPNLLVGGISRAVWSQLNNDPARPMINRATSGTYPPGSTWKLVTGMVGLERKAITPEYVMPIPCSGGMSYAGRYSRCHKREGHGRQNLIQAIANSCNVYFYQLGIALTLKTLTEEGTRLGFGRRTGVDMPGETAGTFPTGKEWYVRRFGWRPPPSEVMNVAIGQGPNSQTPLRMAEFFAAIAGNGTSRAPHLRLGAQAPVETDLRVAPSTLDAVRLGMARVVEEGGTAHAVELARWKLAGKTGTSQNSADPKRHHAWFTGFAGPRGKAPEIVIAVLVEFGESGSKGAAPTAAAIANYYLNKKNGLPTPRLAEPETVRVGASLDGTPPEAIRDTAPGPRPE